MNAILKQYTDCWCIPAIMGILYVMLIYKGQQFMKNRQSYDLRKPMLYWSIMLASFSIVGTARLLMLVIRLYGEGGVNKVICTGGDMETHIHPLWTLAFLYSKFLEYGDTVFIIFRKKKLLFLHWYHHLTVAMFCWLSVKNDYAGSCVFMALNSAVHAAMYTYYSLKAAEYKLPRFLSKSVTIFQIVQMVIGCGFISYIIMNGNDNTCRTSKFHGFFGVAMYVSYFILFANFFHSTYNTKGIKKQTSTIEENGAYVTAAMYDDQSDKSIRRRRN
ncbi:very long chain fatty acid elongase 3-like [Ciona intestinalis]